MATSVDFSKKSLVLVTGASRGIGRTIAVEISRHLDQNSIIILLARSENGLKETQNLIQEIDKSLTVYTFPLDLATANLQTYEAMLDKVISTANISGIEFGIVFHNAGSTGSIVQSIDLTDMNVWQNCYSLNLFSVAVLNSVFIKKVRPIAPQLVIVNVTSLAARSPFLNMAMYGSAKAARDLFFKVLAIEEKNIIILNYSPGPVDTDMFNGVIETAQSEELRNVFKQIKEKSVLTSEQTVGKLLLILEKGDFKSGDVIDYYDRA